MSVIILCEINTAKMWLVCQICDRGILMDLYLQTISSERISNCRKAFIHSVRITQINMKIFYEPVRHSKFGIARVSLSISLVRAKFI